jgi:hypothetical protein
VGLVRRSLSFLLPHLFLSCYRPRRVDPCLRTLWDSRGRAGAHAAPRPNQPTRGPARNGDFPFYPCRWR